MGVVVEALATSVVICVAGVPTIMPTGRAVTAFWIILLCSHLAASGFFVHRMARAGIASLDSMAVVWVSLVGGFFASFVWLHPLLD